VTIGLEPRPGGSLCNSAFLESVWHSKGLEIGVLRKAGLFFRLCKQTGIKR
jgi:hypothetical protein